MANADDLRAQLRIADLEDKLIVAKAGEDIDPAEVRSVKERLRAEREAYRETYRSAEETAAEPETVRASVTVEGN